ncbi:MAG: DUF1508 domain-containing protein [Flavobacteriales bacterium]
MAVKCQCHDRITFIQPIHLHHIPWGKFEKFKDNGGQYRFRLKAGNGEVILASEGYTATPETTVLQCPPNAPEG